MQKLVSGIHHFRDEIFASKQQLFNDLAKGQHPIALFITCSDSRVNPNLVTQTEPGELFVVRNAGNFIPAAPETGGELATIEFAIKSLGIRDVIICGHSDCGAMKGVLQPPKDRSQMPHLSNWLRHGQRTAEIMQTRYSHLSGSQLLTATVEENVLVQIENLKTHDFIAKALELNDLKLYAWVYKFETGQVFSFDPSEQQYRLVNEFSELLPVVPRRKEVTSATAKHSND